MEKETVLNILDYCHYDGNYNVVDVCALNKVLNNNVKTIVVIPPTERSIDGKTIKYILERCKNNHR